MPSMFLSKTNAALSAVILGTSVSPLSSLQISPIEIFEGRRKDSIKTKTQA